MSVSKQYIADLVAELKASEIKREAELLEAKAAADAYRAEVIAEGGCGECLYYYCECDYYQD